MSNEMYLFLIRLSIEFDHLLYFSVNRNKKFLALLFLLRASNETRRANVNNRESSRPSAVPELVQAQWEIRGFPSWSWNNELCKRSKNRSERESRREEDRRCWTGAVRLLLQNWYSESEWCWSRSRHIVLKRSNQVNERKHWMYEPGPLSIALIVWEVRARSRLI